MEEEIPKDIPKPLENFVVTTHYEDAHLSHDIMMCYDLIFTHKYIQKVNYEIILFLYHSILELISVILFARRYVRNVLLYVRDILEIL